jgi:hypothetical protein
MSDSITFTGWRNSAADAVATERRDDGMRLRPTALPGVLRIEGYDALGLDVKNLKGQAARDGLLSVDDAVAHGIQADAWRKATEDPSDPARTLDRVVALVHQYQVAGEEVAAQRKDVLRRAMAAVRVEIEDAKAAGKRVLFPIRCGDHFEAQRPALAHSSFVLDPAGYASLDLTPAESLWFFGELSTKTERTETAGGFVHYMTPAMKALLDDKVRDMAAALLSAHAQGKRSIYVSTFISSGDLETNREIAGFVVEQLRRDPQWGEKLYVVNPCDVQGIPGATGDDYMYMWESLLDLNLFDAIRLTSAADTKAFFAAKGVPVPLDYIFTYGDAATHSAGSRRELNCIVRINRRLAEQGMAHLQVPIYNGDQQVPSSLLDVTVAAVSYAKRGEKI